MTGPLTSRYGLAALVLLLALPLHFIDRAYAVRGARQGLVTQLELQTIKTESDRLQKQLIFTRNLNRTLADKRAEAERELSALEEEIRDYEQDVPAAPDCVVTDRLLRMR